MIHIVNGQQYTANRYNVNSHGGGKGLLFYNGDPHYQISFSDHSSYRYGPVNDWAIKFTNWTGNGIRGWVWGGNWETPVAALNTQGTLQLKKDLRVMGVLGVGIETPQAKLHVKDGKVLIDGWDAVLEATHWDNGNEYKHQVIGTYAGWEKNAIFIAGYNRNFQTTGSDYKTDKVIFGNQNFMCVNYDNGFVGINLRKETNGAFRYPSAALHVDGGALFEEKVRIGTQTPTGANSDYALSVDGKIVAKRIIGTPANWADYVFEEQYNLKSIDDLEEFVIENHHLPNIPSETEVKENGVEMTEMLSLMMEKIEEQALYIIQLNKEIKALKTQINPSK